MCDKSKCWYTFNHSLAGSGLWIVGVGVGSALSYVEKQS